ncbi:Glyco_tran_10_N domain-containing protein [Meloidogyne graminicola]|uniref:Fucosyltransferase n=1 Tax=Meloidogyne graminicola TaxID=189291 RepID=A0A8S9ZJI4_9BILA|nr:Glyco_tran_10_N domain-containing protein [Meloidogyne graminicola]
MDIMTGLYNTEECPYVCEYTKNKDLYLNASAFIFHIRAEHKELPKARSDKQLYVFFLDESPSYTFDHYKDVPPDFFNITMTYRVESDIYYPYDVFIPFKNNERKPDEYWTEKEVMESVLRKKKLAIMVTSDCNTPSKRENLVAELVVLVQCRVISTNHMFYLAFENSVCHHYVTEKFWNLKHLIVPVVLSRRVINQKKIPDNVYIAVDDFNNTAELAEYLLYLQKNKTAYLKYFEWTKIYKKTTYRRHFHSYDLRAHQNYIESQNGTYSPSYNPLCNLCELVHKQNEKGHPPLRINNIWEFWNFTGVCIDNWSNIWLKGNHIKAYKEAKWS